MNNYRSVFSIPEPERPYNPPSPPQPEPPTRNFANDYYKLLSAVDSFIKGEIAFSELGEIRKNLS